jgi:ribosome-binding protein aMBF1 (putative translation factor)
MKSNGIIYKSIVKSIEHQKIIVDKKLITKFEHLITRIT